MSALEWTSLVVSVASLFFSAVAALKVEEFEEDIDDVVEEIGDALGNEEARLEILEDKAGIPHPGVLTHPPATLDDDWQPIGSEVASGD